MTKRHLLLATYQLGYRVSEDGGTVLDPYGNKVPTRIEKCGHKGQNCRVFSAYVDGDEIKNPVARVVKVCRLQAYQLYKEEIYNPLYRIGHKDGDILNDTATNIILVSRAEMPYGVTHHKHKTHTHWLHIAFVVSESSTVTEMSTKLGVALSTASKYKTSVIKVLQNKPMLKKHLRCVPMRTKAMLKKYFTVKEGQVVKRSHVDREMLLRLISDEGV